MTSAQIVTALSTTISLFGIVVLVFWLYREFRIDKFRQQMFALRDEFFDFARDGGIAFDDPAYGVLRSTMNGYIRFGHRLSLLHALVFWVLSEPTSMRRPAESFESQWSVATENMKADTLQTLKKFRTRMEALVLTHVILNAPILVLLIIPGFIAVIFAERCLAWLGSVFAPELDDFDSAALAYGVQVVE